MLSVCLLLSNCNVRELNMPAPREAVIAMIEAAKPNLVCLQETKLSAINQLLPAEFHGRDSVIYLRMTLVEVSLLSSGRH
jgi:exonuclease III